MSEKHLEDLGRLAVGGMATVHRVRDIHLRRDLAMKVLRKDLAGNDSEVGRFVEEAQVTAQLDHPYIPAVHELGRATDGRAYFTMKLVEGKTLDDLLLDPQADPDDPNRLFGLIQIFLKVCEAVSFAHSRGVIHCDLKPSNVMAGTHGQVFVMDWGIARPEVDRTAPSPAQHPVTVARTEARREPKGKVLGTLGYLSPEQARGKVEQLDERSDVFMLGALLYRIVVGRACYPLAPQKESIARAMFAEIIPPEEGAQGRPISRRLAAIAVKALQLKKEDRHPSVEALRREVEAWVRGAGRHPTRTVPAGTLVIAEGDPGDSAFIVSRGKVQVFKEINGRRQILAEMGPGEIFGEAAIFSALGRTASVESLEEELAGTFVMGDLVRVLARRFHELDAQSKALRERVDDWALHGTVMTHFALHGEAAGPGRRSAKWTPLRQVLVDHLGLPVDRATGYVKAMRGIVLEEAEDRVVLDANAGAVDALPSPTLPDLSVPTFGEAS